MREDVEFMLGEILKYGYAVQIDPWGTAKEGKYRAVVSDKHSAPVLWSAGASIQEAVTKVYCQIVAHSEEKK